MKEDFSRIIEMDIFFFKINYTFCFKLSKLDAKLLLSLKRTLPNPITSMHKAKGK